MNILMVGGTGTLGRQIVRRLLDEGHSVTGYVRDREKAQFLEGWGARLFTGDLRDLNNLPAALEGVEAVITTASSGAGIKGNTIREVDDQGNRRLIDGCKAAGVGLVIFTSILQCDQYPQVRLMQVKQEIEVYLQQSGLNHIIFRPGAFIQGLVSQYAIPVLERKPVQVMGESSPIAYVSTLDVARFYVAALTMPKQWNQIHSLAGPRYWTAFEIIDLCDELAGLEQSPRISRLPLSFMRFLRQAMKYFEWFRYSADFFEFAEVVANGRDFGVPMAETCARFQIPTAELMDVEVFLRNYYQKVKQKLREKNYKEPKVRSPF
ncbi:NAD(P)H-binding protein [Candidatus Cyanaurora vandensis]|uniref:NAD(P)H-binding protein n=1 Tax=Candidatus Cyanaurora vandensis TaxID=2714958 RepID=UPI00257BA383|nr:NAD(P)H-binding protein [Candidatus Cyanaurora vandensis]